MKVKLVKFTNDITTSNIGVTLGGVYGAYSFLENGDVIIESDDLGEISYLYRDEWELVDEA